MRDPAVLAVFALRITADEPSAARFPATCSSNDLADETTQVVQWCKDRGLFRIELLGGLLVG